ncbi:MAG: hypothetical protein ACI4SF_15815 [Oscillospiraceae bacterium]
MAGMICKCGTVLSNSTCPNNVTLRVYTDEEWEKISDCEMIAPWCIPMPKYDVWRCPKCKRIYVYNRTSDKPIMVYKLE